MTLNPKTTDQNTAIDGKGLLASVYLLFVSMDYLQILSVIIEISEILSVSEITVRGSGIE